MVRKATDLTAKQMETLRYLDSIGAPVSITGLPKSCGTLLTLAARGFIKVSIELLPKGKSRLE